MSGSGPGLRRARQAVVYLGGITSLGLWASRDVKTSRDLFLAGRSLPWRVAGTSLVVSDIGAKHMVRLAGDLFLPLFWSSGVSTIPEFLGRLYNIGACTSSSRSSRRSSWWVWWPRSFGAAETVDTLPPVDDSPS